MLKATVALPLTSAGMPAAESGLEACRTFDSHWQGFSGASPTDRAVCPERTEGTRRKPIEGAVYSCCRQDWTDAEGRVRLLYSEGTNQQWCTEVAVLANVATYQRGHSVQAPMHSVARADTQHLSKRHCDWAHSA
jgi:hypothetical protein